MITVGDFRRTLMGAGERAREIAKADMSFAAFLGYGRTFNERIEAEMMGGSNPPV